MLCGRSWGWGWCRASKKRVLRLGESRRICACEELVEERGRHGEGREGANSSCLLSGISWVRQVLAMVGSLGLLLPVYMTKTSGTVRPRTSRCS